MQPACSASPTAFAEAARRAHRLGLDAIELHAAHGYLLHQFLSPIANARSDDYGGSLANRMRFPLQVFDAVRAAVPASMPVGVRVSATDWVEGGWDVEQCVAFARALQARGLSFLHVSSGGVSPKQQIPLGPGYQVGLAEQLKRETGVPTIAVGLDHRAASRPRPSSPTARPTWWRWRAACCSIRAGPGMRRLSWAQPCDAPPQYWRSQPRGMSGLFGDVRIGMR